MSEERRERTELTRRRLLAAGAASAIAAAFESLPGVAEARRRRKHRKRKKKHPQAEQPAQQASASAAPAAQRSADVVVVGAGFAGLAAALRVVEAGRSVLVLEARNRVGGRVLNAEITGGEITERGGTFVGPTQNRLMALADQFGVGTFPTHTGGESVYVADGSRSTWDEQTAPTGTAPFDPVILPDLTLTVTQLDQMATEVSADTPWTASSAADWDQQTLGSWLAANTVTPRFRSLAAAATRAIFGAEPRELSLLYTLWYIAASGDETHQGTFERNFSTKGGAQENRFDGGSQRLALAVAQGLGDRVVLGSPVRRIIQENGGATVIGDAGSVAAKRVIVAVPPTLAGRIDYAPALPFDRDQLTQRVPQGTMTKVTAVYDEPFWREDGLSGFAVSTDGYVNVVFDDSPEDGSPGVLFGFVGGDKARGFNTLTDAQRRSEVLNEFVTYYGSGASSPVQYFETNWSSEQWTRGCPTGIHPPGTLTAYGPSLRNPVGPIHWAGTETSSYWTGYMDGAVRSGERAAAEVLAEI